MTGPAAPRAPRRLGWAAGLAGLAVAALAVWWVTRPPAAPPASHDDGAEAIAAGDAPAPPSHEAPTEAANSRAGEARPGDARSDEDGPDSMARSTIERRVRRTVERDLSVFPRLAENHDIAPADSLAISQLLLDERRNVEALLNSDLDVSALNAAVEDLRERTDDDVARLLGGTQRRAYQLMRAGRGDDVRQAARAAAYE